MSKKQEGTLWNDYDFLPENDRHNHKELDGSSSHLGSYDFSFGVYQIKDFRYVINSPQKIHVKIYMGTSVQNYNEKG